VGAIDLLQDALATSLDSNFKANRLLLAVENSTLHLMAGSRRGMDVQEKEECL